MSGFSRFLDARRTHAPAPPGFDNDHVTRALLACVAFSLALFIATTPAWLLDPRTLDGASVWTKPQKFNVSLALHFLTLAVLAQQLPRAVRAGPTLSLFAYTALAATLFEQIYISIQAARGRRSHFNYETAFESQIYMLMGLGALMLVFVAIVLAVQVWRKGSREFPAYRLGTILGLFLGAFATIAFAGYMSMSGSHHVGEHPAGGAIVPFFGWSRETGDLRPAHFAALHMMQTLPLVGYLFDRIRGPGKAAVLLIGALQGALAAALFAQALGGKPFWPA